MVPLTAGTEETLAATSPGALAGGAVGTSGGSVGRYLVIEALGSGGMGVVFAAYDPELDRKVALKLLHGPRIRAETQDKARAKVMHVLFGDDAPTPPSPDQGRLLREAQAVAKVNHPNVVTVHDVGEHLGRVFIAMEYIDGGTLGAWVRKQPRRWSAIVQTMLQAGAGLVAAHECGLVHRDFKPDNVMIDSSGRARVMDFGLVRSDDSSATTGELRPTNDALGMALTHDGAVMGTPAYMSPEQYLGTTVGQASDQFSFCVTLWEALYGQRPFGGQSVEALAFAVTNGEREPPPADVSVPAHVRRVLERGMQIAPEDRYPSMRALLADLRRNPARTRRWIVAGAGLLAVAGAVFGAREIDRRRSLANCRDDAEGIAAVWGDEARTRMQSGMAETNLPFSATVFEKVQPWLDRYAEAWTAARAPACEAAVFNSDATAKQTLECLDERAAELQNVVVALSEPNGEMMRAAVLRASQLPPIAICTDPRHLQLHEPLPDDPQEASAVRGVRGRLARAVRLQDQGKFDESLAALEGASDEATALGQHVLAGRIQLAVGLLLEQKGDYSRSETVLAEAAFALLRAGADGYSADAAMRLALVVAHRQSRHDEGLVWGRWAEALLDRTGPEGSLRDAKLHNELAVIAENHGDYAEAVRRYERGLELSEQLVGADHPRVGTALNNLGSVHSKLGHDDVALSLYERALTVSASALGRDHPDTALPLNNMAKIHWRRGELGAAKEAMARSLAIQEAALGPDHPQVGVSVRNFGLIQRDLGDHAGALRSHERSLDILQRRLPENHPQIAMSFANLGDTQRGLGDLEQAQENHRRALAIAEESLGPEHIDVANTLTSIAMDLHEQEEFASALESLERAQAIYKKTVGVQHVDYGTLLLSIGLNSLANDQPQAALEPLRQALDIFEANDVGGRSQGRARFLLARALDQTGGDKGSATKLAQEAKRQLQSAEQSDPELLAQVTAWLEDR